MKKILLATTMLAGTAGFAAAEVAISGYVEMGIASYTNGDIGFWQDADVTFAMSGTTDGGLEFGASVDLDESDDTTGVGGTARRDHGATVYISGSFGKLTMGDTDGALDWAVQDAGALTSIADDHTSHVAYFDGNGLDGEGDGQVARYENSFGGVSFAISAEQEDEGATGGPDDILGVGVKYTADLGGTALNLGLGYQKGNIANINGSAVGVSVGAELASGFSASLGFIQYDYDPAANVDFDELGLGLTYKTGALSLHANYGKRSPDVGASEDSWGIAANYDLGGGAVVMAGYGSDMDAATAGDQDTWSIGLGMSF